ncbi:MAG: hypothetical protein SPG80_00170 [Candidatus Ventricola sp.]|nr:hypothetical protein [Candidatus Ventricola sp.]
MTARDYLSQARVLDQAINARLERIARLRALVSGRAARTDGMPRGSAGSAGSTFFDWTDTVVKIDEMERALDKDIDRLIDLKREIAEVIAAVPDMRYRTLLEYRYLCGWSWARIARAMHYGEDWVRHAHGWALKQVRVPE